MSHNHLDVAVPWSLSHYISVNAFHPLYRSLFDLAPQKINLNAWDNIKLQQYLEENVDTRNLIIEAARKEENKDQISIAKSDMSKIYHDLFIPPDKILTQILPGDIEFHHTIPFPSFKRPFVFHLECISLLTHSLEWQDKGYPEYVKQLRDHYQPIFSHPLCLGVFSHIPNTLDSLSKLFNDPQIDAKLFFSKMGLSPLGCYQSRGSKKSDITTPRFLFINSAHQLPQNFFNRGGHIALQFWKKFISDGRNGMLIIRCSKPSDELLLEYGVDIEFIKSQMNHTIIWAEDYLSNHEMNALIQDAHFFLLPSIFLHSVSIMQSMMLGTIPIVTDTIGTSTYLKDGEHGIILKGQKKVTWQKDPVTEANIFHYKKDHNLDNSLVSQLYTRVNEILDVPNSYEEMRNRAMIHIQENFSGEEFSKQFWNQVVILYKKHKSSFSPIKRELNYINQAFEKCIIPKNNFGQIFESPVQPLAKIKIGKWIILEFGGIVKMCHFPGPQVVRNWSVLSPYYYSNTPQLRMSYTLEGLEGDYLDIKAHHIPKIQYITIKYIMGKLKCFPIIFDLAASFLRFCSRSRLVLIKIKKFIVFRYLKKGNEDLEIIMQNVMGYNIVRYFHKFYAIEQNKGNLEYSKILSNEYSPLYSGWSVTSIQKRILKNSQKTP